MPFSIKKLSIQDLILVEPKLFEDSRGFFAEIYKQSDFASFGFSKPIAQINYSQSVRNVVRGLHYQLNPNAQAKFVQVINGHILDVVVDLRKGSSSYGKWATEELSSKNLNILYVPEGFAHGFCVLSDTALVTYYCTSLYSPKDERGVAWDDPAINIKWPVKNPLVSDKDKKLPRLEEAENNFTYNG